MAILLKNATYIDWRTLEFTESDILVEEGLKGKIKLFYPGEANEERDETIDCTGKFVTKSFANGHHHVYSALSRGMPPPEKAPQNFYENLQYIWWRLDKALDLDIIEASALFTAMECAKNGVTYVIDHHASPSAVKGSLETIAKAFNKVGVSNLLCYEISDRDGEKSTQEGLDETAEYLADNDGLVGLHASFTVSDKTLASAVKIAEKHNSGIHIHTAEDKIDQVKCIEDYGFRVINRLKEFNVLEFPKTILAHCIHLNDEERKLLKNSEAWIVLNIESNIKNNVGIFSSARLGENIMLGTDGMHSDMLRSAKAAYLNLLRIDKTNPEKIYERFRNVSNYLYQNNFNGDGENNLVVLDYKSPTDLKQDNFLSHFIYGIESKHIQHVISNGKLIVKDKQLTQVNESEMLEYSMEMGNKLWKKLS